MPPALDDTLDSAMPVDIGPVLHVLAHELRTPIGIAHGYVRMLLDDQLTDPDECRRALEQTQKALARLGELTQESSKLARWFAEPRAPSTDRISAAALIERVVASARTDRPLRVHSDAVDSIAISTFDANALAGALATVVRVTARELLDAPCTIGLRAGDRRGVDFLIGAENQLPKLAAGPDSADATPMSLERGGVGLLLVSAAAVLDAHGATGWTIGGARNTVGIRLPSEERHLA